MQPLDRSLASPEVYQPAESWLVRWEPGYLVPGLPAVPPAGLGRSCGVRAHRVVPAAMVPPHNRPDGSRQSASAEPRTSNWRYANENVGVMLRPCVLR